MATLSRLRHCRPLVSRLFSRTPVHLAGVRSIHGPAKPDEYSEVAQYPEILAYRTEDEKEQANLVINLCMIVRGRISLDSRHDSSMFEEVINTSIKT